MQLMGIVTINNARSAIPENFFANPVTIVIGCSNSFLDKLKYHHSKEVYRMKFKLHSSHGA